MNLKIFDYDKYRNGGLLIVKITYLYYIKQGIS